MSSLQSIYSFNLDSDLVQKFLKDYTILAKNGKNIILCWIPSHVGILGNEKADTAARSALSLPVIRMKLPATDMYPRITKLIFDEWQLVWDCCAGNKLHVIRPTVGDHKQKACLSRRDSVLLNRLRIGHTRLTHSFLLSDDDLPECRTCQCPLTVKHILVECVILKMYEINTLLLLPLKIYLIILKHIKTLILLKKLVFISNINVFILMFVICFFYSSLIALILHS